MVSAVSCEPPLLNLGSDMEHVMVYSCPTLYTVGSQCNIWCKSGYPRAGTDTITCGFDMSGNAVWQWDGFKPFCQSMDILLIFISWYIKLSRNGDLPNVNIPLNCHCGSKVRFIIIKYLFFTGCRCARSISKFNLGKQRSNN